MSTEPPPSKKPRIAADQVEKLYVNFKKAMSSIASNIDLKIDYNANIVAGYLIQYVVRKGKAPRGRKETDVQQFTLFKAADEKDMTSQGITEVLWKPTDVSMKAAQEILYSDGMDAGAWYPFFALQQLAFKTTDSLLYQKNTVCRDMGLPASCEVFAQGKNISNRLKKSRPHIVGPLAHLANLIKLQSMRKDVAAMRNSKLLPATLNDIESRYGTWLKDQLISPVQKSLVDCFIRQQDYTHLATFGLSLLSIKPRIEHFFVLTPDLLFHLGDEDFKGAGMSNEWPFKMFEKAMKTAKVYSPAGWSHKLSICKLMSVFQCWGEPLEVVNALWGAEVTPRNTWNKYPNQDEHFILKATPFEYKLWAKPQRGAPRNIKGERDNQVCSVPSFRGQRTSYNQYSTLEEALKAVPVDTSLNLKEQLAEEYEKYAKLPMEGTGSFYKRGTNEEVVMSGLKKQTWFLST